MAGAAGLATKQALHILGVHPAGWGLAAGLGGPAAPPTGGAGTPPSPGGVMWRVDIPPRQKLRF
jgi:hypothetical protein